MNRRIPIIIRDDGVTVLLFCNCPTCQNAINNNTSFINRVARLGE